MLWPQPHVSSPRAAELQDLCHLCSHLLPLWWHPLGTQRASSCEGPKGPRAGGGMCLKAARGSLAERLLEGSQGCPGGGGSLLGLWGGLVVPELHFLTRICHSTPHWCRTTWLSLNHKVLLTPHTFFFFFWKSLQFSHGFPFCYTHL